MTLRLILTRHAKSDWSHTGMADHERPLNHHGQDEAAALGAWLKSRGYLPDQIIVSNSQRTVETAHLVQNALGTQPSRSTRRQLYQADADTLLGELNHANGQTIMLIAHNPGIQTFAQQLIRDASTHPRLQGYPTACTAVIDFTEEDWVDVTAGRGALRDVFIPED